MSRKASLSGFHEWLPAERLVEQHVLDTLRRTFELHGFAGIETRAVETLGQLLRKGEQSSQYLRALLLPEISAISRPASLITPRLPFQESHKVVINLSGDETRAILSRKQTSTASFSQFEYRVLGEANTSSGTSVTAAKDPGKSGDEDFDSLWKSL